MVLPIAVLLTVGTLMFTLLVRAKDVPDAMPVSPTQHLEERKAQIYDNLRNLHSNTASANFPTRTIRKPNATCKPSSPVSWRRSTPSKNNSRRLSAPPRQACP